MISDRFFVVIVHVDLEASAVVDRDGATVTVVDTGWGDGEPVGVGVPTRARVGGGVQLDRLRPVIAVVERLRPRDLVPVVRSTSGISDGEAPPSVCGIACVRVVIHNGQRLVVRPLVVHRKGVGNVRLADIDRSLASLGDGDRRLSS